MSQLGGCAVACRVMPYVSPTFVRLQEYEMEKYTFNAKKDIFKYPITYLLILINIIIFAMLNLFSEASNVLLLDPNHVVEAPWTLITVFFSHELLIHLVTNMGLLFLFGRMLERIVGGGNLLIAYLLCGFLGSVTIIPFADVIQWIGPVAGASAAVFGVVAALGAIEPDRVIMKGTVKQWVLALFVVNALIFIMNPTVSIGGPAHAIGLIAGYIIGQWMKQHAAAVTISL